MKIIRCDYYPNTPMVPFLLWQVCHDTIDPLIEAPVSYRIAAMFGLPGEYSTSEIIMKLLALRESDVTRSQLLCEPTTAYSEADVLLVLSCARALRNQVQVFEGILDYVSWTADDTSQTEYHALAVNGCQNGAIVLNPKGYKTLIVVEEPEFHSNHIWRSILYQSTWSKFKGKKSSYWARERVSVVLSRW